MVTEGGGGEEEQEEEETLRQEGWKEKMSK